MEKQVIDNPKLSLYNKSAASITPGALLVTLVQTIGNSNEIYKCPNWIFYIVESFNLIHFQAKTFEASASRGTFN